MPAQTDDLNVVVRAQLSERGIRFESGGNALRIPHGSAEVLIEFDDLENGGAVVHVSAVVLTEVAGADEKGEFAVLRALNDRNRVLRFGCLSYDPDREEVRLRYSILGDQMQPEEFLNAVTSVAKIADDYDDVLAREVGGRRAQDRRPS